jgi:hypothetical protein
MALLRVRRAALAAPRTVVDVSIHNLATQSPETFDFDADLGGNLFMPVEFDHAGGQDSDCCPNPLQTMPWLGTPWWGR